MPKKKQECAQSPTEDQLVISKLYEIMEAISDRVEMHKNIGEQRNNWNSLLLTSINGLILGAATMAAISATSAVNFPVLALKVSSMTMYLAATGMLVVMNKIQPSQLAEEQRNSARLFQNLGFQLQKLISIGYPTDDDVKDMMERVLALDKAYPLPLLGAMLDKLTCKTEPAVWWPKPRPPREKGVARKNEYNGWNKNLEVEMRQIMGQVRKNDVEDYLRLGNKALKLNKMLAISGPILTTLAAIGSVFVDSSSYGGSLAAAMLGIVGGALAAAVNGFEHGGQVGMVFEMYRSNAGFFKFMEESIEMNLDESDVEKRDNGELLKMKVALQLGRTPKEIKDLNASSLRNEGQVDEFASKLF
ncbi:hypothetical protein LIER_38005 [Lithospermum erythrorhizon]|uniref:F-box protein n=1 Tax=Lithospermum erythrorhizon TaxID=34254 RepID=A0AAV3PV54_LITER